MSNNETWEKRFDDLEGIPFELHSVDPNANVDLRKTIAFFKDFIRSELTLARREEREKANTELIVDLYEARASFNRPIGWREVQDIGEVLKYNFFNSLIANLSDKYGVEESSLREEIQRREHKKQLASLSPHLHYP